MGGGGGCLTWAGCTGGSCGNRRRPPSGAAWTRACATRPSWTYKGARSGGGIICHVSRLCPWSDSHFQPRVKLPISAHVQIQARLTGPKKHPGSTHRVKVLTCTTLLSDWNFPPTPRPQTRGHYPDPAPISRPAQGTARRVKASSLGLTRRPKVLPLSPFPGPRFSARSYPPDQNFHPKSRFKLNCHHTQQIKGPTLAALRVPRFTRRPRPQAQGPPQAPPRDASFGNSVVRHLLQMIEHCRHFLDSAHDFLRVVSVLLAAREAPVQGHLPA